MDTKVAISKPRLNLVPIEEERFLVEGIPVEAVPVWHGELEVTAFRVGRFAYVTVGGLNAVLAFRTDNFEQVARIPVGELPHGIWPSGDGTRIYVGIENGDTVTAIDTLENKVVATVPIGQAAQAVGEALRDLRRTDRTAPEILARPHLPLGGVRQNRPDAFGHHGEIDFGDGQRALALWAA